ncbi:TonB-dependent receptor domain-containing protein, partial [Silvimonas sp.]|uniref:TonB-dependent receptor domain-containing protein n=1 Tax=Silvimonas sp. TaxID=2650811 RepID=UPI0028492AA6
MNVQTVPGRFVRKEVRSSNHKQLCRQGMAEGTVLSIMRRASFALLIGVAPMLALNVLAPSAYGQASSSSDAVGRVTDATGASIAGAVVHLINNATGAERVATTNESGDWSIPNIPPASYRLRIEKPGFKSSEIKALEVEIGKASDSKTVLSIGSATETVEVTTMPPQLQTQEATVGQVISSAQINDLPLNGRNVLQLATLAPGVSPAQTGQTGVPGRYGQRQIFITVDGGRASSTNYVLDGTYIRSVRFNNMSILPDVEALQEFNLLRNSFSTEYGQGEAVVSMVTKSGSNSLHGSAYDFARNSIFDARNYFATPAAIGSSVKPHFSRQQYGGSAGLPIKRDKMFVFGAFEGLRTSRDTPVFAFYPTAAQLGTATNTFTQVLQPTIPTPTTAGALPSLPGGNNYSSIAVTTDNFDEYVVRADQTLSSRNMLFERYIDYNSLEYIPNSTGGNGGINNKLIGRNAVIGHTFLISPTIVNEVRAGYNSYYNWEIGVGINPGTNWDKKIGLANVSGLTDPTLYGRPTFTIVGFSQVFDSYTNQGGNENILSFGDSLSFIKGKHTLKAGFQMQNRRIILRADNNSTGTFTFGAGGGTDPSTGNPYTALANYQRGFCTICVGNNGTTLGHYRDNTYGAFISDVWQVGRKLTVNAGLRWEYSAPFVEQNGLEGTLNPSSGKIEYSKVPALSSIPTIFLPYVETTNTFNPGIINPNKKGFGPRIGIAYEVRPGLVFRAGGGIYFDNINTNELQFTRYAAPLYYQQSLNNQFISNLFPDPKTLALTSAGLPAPFSILPNNTTPYTMEWNASVQKDIGKGVTVEVAYTAVGTHHLWKRYDQNMDELTPGLTSPGVSNTTNVGVRPFPAFQHGILTTSTKASANFNGGSVKVEKRMGNGLFVLGSYQWSKNLDNNTGEQDANDTSYASNFAFDHSYA